MLVVKWNPVWELSSLRFKRQDRRLPSPLVFVIALLMIFSRTISPLLCIVFNLCTIPLITCSQCWEGNKLGILTLSTTLVHSLMNKINASWSLHLSPKVALEMMLYVIDDISSVRLIVDPVFIEIYLINFDNSSSRIDWNDFARLALNNSNVHIFFIFLQ